MRLALGDISSSQAGSVVQACVRGTCDNYVGAVSFRGHHVLITHYLRHVQCHSLSSGLRHLSSTLVSKSTCLAITVRCRIPRSPQCDLQIVRCVKLSLVSLVQWILNSLFHKSKISPDTESLLACLHSHLLSYLPSLEQVWGTSQGIGKDEIRGSRQFNPNFLFP